MGRVLLVLPALVLLQISLAGAWDEDFSFHECYTDGPSQRMPNTLDTLIGIIEKYEYRMGQTVLDELSEMIIKRYRKDSVVFDAVSGGLHDYQYGDIHEKDKQEVVMDVINPSKDFQSDSFEPREECGLHFMVSHSTDEYPHDGVDDIWDGTIDRSNRNDRNKRAIFGSSSSSSSSSSNSKSSDQSSASSYNSYSSSSGAKRSRASNLPDGIDPAIHPIESGVMETPYGPIAGGTLISALSVLDSASETSVAGVFNNDQEIAYMPNQMQTARINRVYAASLAGDIAQLALLAEDSNPKVGPAGRFNNCTACAQIFSLENRAWSYLSRAEIFAGIDAIIIYTAQHDSSNSMNFVDSLSLSQLLRHYYSEKGLPGMPEVRACNRLKLYNRLDKDKIFEQALHFTYMYQHYLPNIQEEVRQHRNDFPYIENNFSNAVTRAKEVLDNFINSYSYDDEGYNSCYYGPSTYRAAGNLAGILGDVPSSEGMTDFIAVVSEQGTKDDAREQRQFIADIARRLGVSLERSKIGIIRGTDGNWLQPMSNISNVGDWACNFTNSDETTSGKIDVDAVLNTLSEHYHNFYHEALTDMDISSGRSQVVLWQMYGTPDVDENTINRTLGNFKSSYPDVDMICLGQNSRSDDVCSKMAEYEDDYISTSGKTYEELLVESVNRIKQSPRFFIYPACDPENSTLTSNYREESHMYEGYVYPNFTTYITIHPKNFIYSEELTIRVENDARACFSRTNRLALENYIIKSVNDHRDHSDDTIVCVGGPDDDEENEVTFKYLCDQYIYSCNPLYISITGLDSKSSRSTCYGANNNCEFPSQVKYELTHKGMKCGCSSTSPIFLLMVATAFLLRFFQ